MPNVDLKRSSHPFEKAWNFFALPYTVVPDCWIVCVSSFGCPQFSMTTNWFVSTVFSFLFPRLTNVAGFKLSSSGQRCKVKTNLRNLKLCEPSSVASLEDSSIFKQLIVEEIVHAYFAVRLSFRWLKFVGIILFIMNAILQSPMGTLCLWFPLAHNAGSSDPIVGQEKRFFAGINV